MASSQLRFPKSSRLHLRKDINELFVSGKSFQVPPFRVVYKQMPFSDASLKIAISIPKRNFKHAVDRNRIKRQVREAFRINSPDIREYFCNAGVTIHFLLVCNCKVLPEYADITSKIILILHRLKQLHERAAG